MKVRRFHLASTAIAGVLLLGLAGCSGLGARILSVGQTVEADGLTITYVGSVTENAVLDGIAESVDAFPANETTDYVRYVFEVTNPSENEVNVSDVLPVSFAYDTGEEVEGAFPSPSFVSVADDGSADTSIAPGATEQVSVVVELPKDQAESPASLTTTLNFHGQAYEIQGDTIEQGGNFQETTKGVAEDFSELLMTRYQDFVYTAGEQATSNPQEAYQTVRDAAQTAAGAVEIYKDELESVDTPSLYGKTAEPLLSLLERFETYFTELGKLNPSNPGASATTLDQLNRNLEKELPDFQADAEQALTNMPYLRGTSFENLVTYFNDLTSYDVNAVAPLEEPAS